MALRIRTYHELTETDQSNIVQQVAAQRKAVAGRLTEVHHIVGVMSGKGGVGKSYVTAHLATHLAAQQRRVGVLDADLNGPTIPRLLGIGRPPMRTTQDGVEPALTADGVRVFSMAFLLADGAPLRWKEPSGEAYLWRGTLEAGTLRELLADVAWGELDVLLVDLPPGAPRVADLHEWVPNLSGILAVTIPSDESLDVVRRALALARERDISLLGIVENMAGVRCSSCGRHERVFPGEAGSSLAAEFGIDLLARLPFAPDAAAFREIAAKLAAKMGPL